MHPVLKQGSHIKFEKRTSKLTACGAGRSGPVELARPQRDGWNPARNEDFPPELHLPRGGGGVSSTAMLPRPKPAYESAMGEYDSILSDDDEATGSDLLDLRPPPLFGGFLCFRTLLRRLQQATKCLLCYSKL